MKTEQLKSIGLINREGFLLSLDYVQTEGGWTHKDLDGDVLTLEEAYEYEVAQLSSQGKQVK